MNLVRRYLRNPACAARIAVVCCTLSLIVSCNNTPTEITPLPRAVGEVEALRLNVTSLAPLDANTEGVYFLWALLERNQTESLGPFFVDAAGQVVDSDGTLIDGFRSDTFALRKTLGVLVTIEVPGQAPDTPGGMQLLSGTIIDGVARLSVPISSSIVSGAGSLRIFTPTDGPDTNETSGFWTSDDNGDPSLDLPDTTAALQYETFIEIGGQTLNLGRFDLVDAADDFCRFCSDVAPPPERPGDDLLVNAPEGLTFPTDLSGTRITISLEGRFNDIVTRSQLIVLEANVPLGIVAGQTVPFVNRTDSFPSGTAVLY